MAIHNFKHNGLKELFYNDSTKGINPKHKNKLVRILDAIQASHHPRDLKALYQGKFQEKKGGGKGVYTIEVNGNWRVTFEIKDQGAVLVDYRDYHGKKITRKSG